MAGGRVTGSGSHKLHSLTRYIPHSHPPTRPHHPLTTHLSIPPALTSASPRIPLTHRPTDSPQAHANTAAQVDIRDGKEIQVFFAKEPGGLCYCFHQRLKLIRGLSAFPITPQAPDGTIDTVGLAKLVARLVTARVDSIGLLGSTGTYAYLSREQRRVAVQTAAATIAAASEGHPKPKLLVGIGHIRTDACIDLAADALAAGADAALLAPVSYTPLLDEEVFQHFAAVAAAVPLLPLVIYSNPSTTKFEFSDVLVERLAKELGTSVIGLKRGGGPDGTDHAAAHRALADAVGVRSSIDFTLGYAGDWRVIGPLLGGGEAWFSVIGGIFPERCQAILEAVQDNDAAKARALSDQLQPIWDTMAATGSLRVAYSICNILGLVNAAPPRPLLPLPRELHDAVHAALLTCGLLDA
eukprot:m.310710 g.310710  ORF g.310710 m.310710 type:complete len:411 (-) comp27438_c0_seq10:2898-4130(-)